MEGSEKEKMLSGELYRASDPELVRDRRRCRSLLRSFNTQPEEEQRLAVLRDLLGVGDDAIIGAGSVVTRDIPAGVVAVGAPCRVVRKL